MEMDFLQDLNSKQCEAVTSTEGRIRVVAGAGTGKTKALTYRYAYLVNVLGIDPANILCLTFTNKAAAEMRQRISAMVHSGDYNDFVCTIHGFCVKLLRKEIYRLGFPKTFNILDEDDCKALAKETMDELGIKRTEKTVKTFLEGVGASKALDDYIVTYMLPDSAISANHLPGASSEYASAVGENVGVPKSELANYIGRQMKNYSLDFDDLVNFTKYILDHFQDAREYWQNELNYIMVDEAQDCNADDWEIIEKLAQKHHNLFIVGDPDQAIYEWRGAKPDRFVQFASDKDVVLDENYRSTPNILDVANSVISHNQNRIPKDLFTRKAAERMVIHFHGKTEREEMEWIAKQIILLHDAGASFSDFAILFRSTYLSQSIEQELLREHLPYTVWGGVRFFERKEIKDCLSYLRLINNPEDDLAFSRIANVPSRKIGKAFMERLKASASSSGQSLFNTLKDKVSSPEYSKTGAVSFVAMIDECRELAQASAVSDLLNRVLAESGLKKEIRENQDEDRLENVDELLHSIRFYEESHKDDEITLSDYLQDIALYTNADYRKDTSVIKLMTIHQAKGLEFPYVFIIGLSEGTFPNMRTIREYKKNGEEEERRLMYVAVTRAEKALFLTESEGFNVSTKMNKYPSRFLTEIQREMFVTEGFVPEELWKGTKNLKHVLDEEIYGNPVEPSSGVDGFAAERAEYHSGFEVGDEVVHKVFGEGVIISANSEWTSFQVQFQDGTIRQIRSSFLSFPDLPE